MGSDVSGSRDPFALQYLGTRLEEDLLEPDAQLDVRGFDVVL